MKPYPMSAIETADLFRGAYLLTQGARLIDTHVARNQVHFVIEGEGVSEHDERYRLGHALVNPVALRETLNLLRDLIFERLRQEKTQHGAHPRHRDRTAQVQR
jgi:hypothetical protein